VVILDAADVCAESGEGGVGEGGADVAEVVGEFVAAQAHAALGEQGGFRGVLVGLQGGQCFQSLNNPMKGQCN
jgi:hypothetical protein